MALECSDCAFKRTQALLEMKLVIACMHADLYLIGIFTGTPPAEILTLAVRVSTSVDV